MDEIINSPVAENKKKFFKDFTPFGKNLFISVIVVLVTVVLLMCLRAVSPDNKTEKHDWFDIEAISELTTIECRYHNVAVYDREKGWFGSGDQYVWMEYDVIVEVGIDTDKMKIKESEKGIYRIYLPPAEIFSAIDDMSTISKPVCDIGAFADFTLEQESQIIVEGTEKLKNDEMTKGVLDQAYKSAKDIIEQYVTNIGNLIGEEYKVVWVDNPEDF